MDFSITFGMFLNVQSIQKHRGFTMLIRSLILFTVCLFSLQLSWAMEKDLSEKTMNLATDKDAIDLTKITEIIQQFDPKSGMESYQALLPHGWINAIRVSQESEPICDYQDKTKDGISSRAIDKKYFQLLKSLYPLPKKQQQSCCIQ